mgnify:CR=1 FL=1
MDHNPRESSDGYDFTPAREAQKRILAGEFPEGDDLWQAMDSLTGFFENVFFPGNPPEDIYDYPYGDDGDDLLEDDDIYDYNYHDDWPWEDIDDLFQEVIDLIWTHLGYGKELINKYYDRWPRYMPSDDTPSLKEFSMEEAWVQWERAIAESDRKSRNWRKELWEYEAFLASERELVLLAS